ncbi:replication protein P [Zooshikella sp. RANM57]|uniref:replication protein P n=1 Tax=Zooshikella sp. RANM57 TaxID=3425863 RepID=UPI003D6F7ABD
MQSSQQLIQKTLCTSTESRTQAGANNNKKNQARTISELPTREQGILVNEIFAMFEAIYPLQFKKAWPLDIPTQANRGINLDIKLETAKRAWVNNERFRELTAEQVRRGIQRTKSESRFLPSLADFIHYCTEADRDKHNLPTADTAWREVTQHCHEQMTHQWSHEAVYTAAKATDFFRIRSAQGDEVKALKKTFESLYKQLCNRIAHGEQIPDVRPSLEDARSKSPVELNEQYHESKLQEQIKAQGLHQLKSATSALAAIRSRLA